MAQTVVWQRRSVTALEFCTVKESRHGLKYDGWEATGKVIQGGERPLLAEYWIGCDQQGLTRRVYVSLTEATGSGPAGESSRVLIMLTGADGGWKVNGQGRPDLTACPDVDLGISPLTNSLPIRRLKLNPGEASELCAAWVSFPGLTVAPLRQRYTCLAPNRYRYENLESGFAAELEVDDAGLVIRYGDEWRRV